MKNHFIFLMVLLLTAIIGYSQVDIQVTEEIKKMSLGENPAFIVDIPEGNYEAIRKEWISFLEKGTKLKVEAISNELIIKGAVFKKITLDSLNVYSSVYQIDSTIRIIAFFELDSVFISDQEGNAQQKEISSSLKSAVRDFAVAQYIKVYEGKLEVENDLLKDLENERKSRVDEIEKNQNSIKENEENIRQSEDALKIAENDLEYKNDEISTKKLDMAPLKTNDPERYKVANKELSQLEKEKKKIENEREKENKNIVKYNNNISEAERSISQLESEAEELESKIADQEKRIDRLEAEKSRIK